MAGEKVTNSDSTTKTTFGYQYDSSRQANNVVTSPEVNDKSDDDIKKYQIWRPITPQIASRRQNLLCTTTQTPSAIHKQNLLCTTTQTQSAIHKQNLLCTTTPSTNPVKPTEGPIKMEKHTPGFSLGFPLQYTVNEGKLFYPPNGVKRTSFGYKKMVATQYY